VKPVSNPHIAPVAELSALWHSLIWCGQTFQTPLRPGKTLS